MKKRMLSALLAGCLLLTLTGCGQREEQEKKEALQPLAPARVAYDAPDGDSPIPSTETYILYVQGEGELQLARRSVTLTTTDLSDRVNQLTEAQLRSSGETRTALTLYGEQPIELSDGICTVNLAPSALQLSNSAFYKACVALATTLCELDEISFVNVLVADLSVGLDITGSLAMGSLTAHPDENLPVLWEQMEARRTPLEGDLSRTSLSALSTLYYPLEEGMGVGCENRILNFEGQTPQQLATGLFAALDEVIRERGSERADFSLRSLMLHDPLTSELEDGGRLITLSFREDAESMLQGWGLDFSCLIAAVTDTLTTFIPGVAAISVRFGDRPITELHSPFGDITVLGGLVRRSMFEPFLRGSATIFLTKGEGLAALERPVDRDRTDHPRELLEALLAGPTEAERGIGVEASLPEEPREDDILGIAAEGDTLLVNLSGSFRTAIAAFGAERERMLCYSMVDTLCAATGLGRVCFFFEGEQVEAIAGAIYWAGDFRYNPGLILEEN